MSLLPFGTLAPYQARRFVGATTNLGDWAQLAPLFDRLERDLETVADVAQLEAWLLAWSEVSAALEEEGARRHIAMTCHTDDPGAERDYLYFVETIEPQVKPRQFALAQAFVRHPQRGNLPPQRYEVLERDLRVQVELFRPENVPLETEDTKLGQQYQKLAGSLTVNFQGREQTLVQMGRYLEEPERAVRQEAWELVARRRLAERDAFESIFDQLLGLRDRIGRQAGYANYRDYMFRKLGRFDYTPEHCVEFHAAVEAEVMPVVRELQARRQERLGVEVLRPWDLGVDPLNRPPLRPFARVEEMVSGAQRIFDQLDPELAGGFRRMQELRLLDLDNRKGKAPGGYQSTLSEARLPFIFMNAVGVQRDVETILHEAGHAFHALACQGDDLNAYRNPPTEICEVASMSMELLANEFLEAYYAPAEANRARRSHLEGVLGVLPWIATVDAFQHWLYTHPTHTRAERRECWEGLMTRFGGLPDWSGYEDARAYRWHAQLHIFLYPFYYIEYGIAQLGALQVWAHSRADKAGALAAYKRALRLGGSRPLKELFRAAGCAFEFGPRTIQPLIRLIRTELDRLGEV